MLFYTCHSYYKGKATPSFFSDILLLQLARSSNLSVCYPAFSPLILLFNALAMWSLDSGH